MDWGTFFIQLLATLGSQVLLAALLRPLLAHWLARQLAAQSDKEAEERNKRAEERRLLQKRREDDAAVVDILAEWVRPSYTKGPTNEQLWKIQITYWKNIIRLDKDRILDPLIKRLANDKNAPDPREIILEARKSYLGLSKRDLEPDDLNRWLPIKEN